MPIHQAIYDLLKKRASVEQTVTYQVIAAVAGFSLSDSAATGQLDAILGEISTFEHQQGRPLLSVLVLNRNTNMPSPGFFHLARQLGVLATRRIVDEDAFVGSELERVFDAWRGYNGDLVGTTATGDSARSPDIQGALVGDQILRQAICSDVQVIFERRIGNIPLPCLYPLDDSGYALLFVASGRPWHILQRHESGILVSIGQGQSESDVSLSDMGLLAFLSKLLTDHVNVILNERSPSGRMPA